MRKTRKSVSLTIQKYVNMIYATTSPKSNKMIATLNYGYNGTRKDPKLRLLPESFHPSEQDVICGRGRKIFMHIGNERFRKLVAGRLQEYSSTSTKLEKSRIICEMVVHVRTNNPHGGFVKMSTEDGRWYQLRDFLSREKTSQAFRDALSGQYRSTTESKKLRRSRMKHRTVSEGAQLKHQSAINGVKAQCAANPSVFEDPLPLVTPTKGTGVDIYQPSTQEFILHYFDWASHNVMALLEASDEFDLIEGEESSAIIPFDYETFEAPEFTTKFNQVTEQAVVGELDEASIFERLVFLADKILDNGGDPLEPIPLPVIM
jgi:hypothetical protein